MTNFPSTLKSILKFMQREDPNGIWDELEPTEALKEDYIYILETLNDWIDSGLKVTPELENYLAWLEVQRLIK